MEQNKELMSLLLSAISYVYSGEVWQVESCLKQALEIIIVSKQREDKHE